jgi:hypothetical protein
MLCLSAFSYAFLSLPYHFLSIPVRPVTATETVSYSLVILAGLAVAAGAAWAVFKGARPNCPNRPNQN